MVESRETIWEEREMERGMESEEEFGIERMAGETQETGE